MTTEPSKLPPDAWAEIVDMGRTVAYALAIALVIRVVVFQPFTIPSASMEPTLMVGDYIVISKWSYGWSRHSLPFSPPLPGGRVFGKAPARGDVVVFKLPRDTKVTYVKRLIGLPGDRVRLAGGGVTVNGKAIPRTVVGRTVDPTLGGLPVTEAREVKPGGKPYITWDQGPGREGDDTGTFIVPAGYYFVLGDNRDNSLDSRWPKALGVGFVPAENLMGRARFILMSWKEGASFFKPWTWLSLRGDRFFRGVP